MENDGRYEKCNLECGSQFLQPFGTARKECSQMLEMLFKAGMNFNDYPVHFKRGTFVMPKTATRELTNEERMRIPEKNRPEESMTFVRSSIEEIEMPVLSKVINRVGVLFYGEDPMIESENQENVIELPENVVSFQTAKHI